MQVALESHQGFSVACEGDPGIGQTTRVCKCEMSFLLCLSYTSVNAKKRYLSLFFFLSWFFFFWAKTLAVCLNFQLRYSGERLAILKSLAILLLKVQFTAKMAKSLSDGIWYPGCALHSKLLCCLPSKLMPTNFK